MPKSYESYALPQEDYRREINDYFSNSLSEEELAWLNENGYTCTRNLHLRFMDYPIGRNGYNPYQKDEYWPVVEAFREQNPDLWDEVKNNALQRIEEAKKYDDPDMLIEFLELPRSEQQRIIDEDNERSRQFEVVKNRAFDTLAPMIVAANLKHEDGTPVTPLDLCI